MNPNRPMFVTGLVAACLVLLLVLANPVTRYFVPRLDPNISFETDGERTSAAASRTQMTTREASLFDGEVYRTEGRLREMSVLAIAAYSTVLDGHFHGRSPSSVERLLATVDLTPLSRIGLEPLPDGTGFTSAHNIFHVRFRPRLLDVEIIATPRARNDGAALLMRVPETDAYDLPPGRLRYFEAQRLDDVRIPAPFATSAQIQADGWQSQIMNSQLPVDVAPDRLMRWAQDQARHSNPSQASK
ncbi:MAG: hypothetical protein MSG64_20950 [Pyrinomonadaceae bacterium MAG19_C2-C3]|nr:hypothetical protein [Pyrinomonadaceae bacterium MAG19_C2-C3]